MEDSRTRPVLQTASGDSSVQQHQLLLESAQLSAVLLSDSRRALLDFLDKYPGPKTICFDPEVVSPLSFIVKPRELSERLAHSLYTISAWPCGDPYQTLKATDTLPVNPGIPPVVLDGACTQILFLCRPNLGIIPKILRTLETRIGGPAISELNCVIGFLPFSHEVVQHHVREQLSGLDLKSLNIESVPLYCFPFEDDLISLELPAAYRQCHLDSADGTLCLDAVADGVGRLLRGITNHEELPRILSIGLAGKFVYDKLFEGVKRQRERASALKEKRSNAEERAQQQWARSDLLRVTPPVKYILNKETDTDKVTPAQQHTTATTGGNGTAGISPVEDVDVPVDVPVDCAVIIDRRVDMVTPMTSQFTYAGLMDEIIGINQTFLTLPEACVSAPSTHKGADSSAPSEASGGNQNTPGPIKIQLTSAADPIYAEIRDLHQVQVGNHLHLKASAIQEAYEEKNKLKTIPEISNFMKMFKVKQAEHLSLTTHVNVASYLSSMSKSPVYLEKLRLEDTILESTSAKNDIVTAVEEIISYDKCTVEEAYRLMCLMAFAWNGLPHKSLDSLKKLIVQHYGLAELVRMDNLEVSGIFYPQSGRASATWRAVKKAFDLFVPDSMSANDYAYVCSGYAPLSVRLVEALHKHPQGWRNCAEALHKLWGPALDSLHLMSDAAKQSSIAARSTQSVVIVIFVGGCTFSEISALRRLSALSGYRRQYLVVTTEVINYRTFFNSFNEPCCMPPVLSDGTASR
eukprot:Lankesteria_metandrocarpae@DN3595_c0_g1_i2.p1